MISLILNLTKKYIYIFILILIPCLIFSNKLFATGNNFLVEDLEISEKFFLFVVQKDQKITLLKMNS